MRQFTSRVVSSKTNDEHDVVACLSSVVKHVANEKPTCPSQSTCVLP